MKHLMNIFAVLALTASFGVAAQESPGLVRTPAPAGASVSFAELSDGDVVPPTFRVEFVLEGMNVVPAGEQAENSGHHHLLIDVEEMPPMDLPLPATDNIVHFGDGASGAQVTLPPGEHSLQLLFADYRHVPHEPPVMSEKIVITVSRDSY